MFIAFNVHNSNANNIKVRTMHVQIILIGCSIKDYGYTGIC